MLKTATIKQLRQDVLTRANDVNSPSDTAFIIKIQDKLLWHNEGGKLFVCHKSYACEDFSWYFLKLCDENFINDSYEEINLSEYSYCSLHIYNPNAIDYFKLYKKDRLKDRQSIILKNDDNEIIELVYRY